MKVILPDRSELELPDGATGLDAARAIGPKLAEQAVLVRSNGRVRDLRLPLEDGEEIQILTTRDKDDPDALYVLRHSAAHLLAEAARRLYPGTKVAIGPPIENGFYYDFEFPEPVGEEALERLEEEISFYRQGDFVDLCRGPHLQNTKPIRAVKLLSLAGAYWRGDESKQQLTRVYGTAFYDPKDLRRRENARRGYKEVRTPQLYDADLWRTSGHWDKFRENMFTLEIEGRDFG